MDDDDFTCDGTSIVFEYGELSARVIMSTNLSPDYVDTILGDLRKQVIAGVRQLGMTYQAVDATDAD